MEQKENHHFMRVRIPNLGHTQTKKGFLSRKLTNECVFYKVHKRDPKAASREGHTVSELVSCALGPDGRRMSLAHA